MSDFAVYVESVADVSDHPNADRLSIVKIRGFNCIANKLEDGTPRYKVGDLVVYVPEGAIVPEYLLRPGFWDEKNNKGGLAGPAGNRVKAIRLRNVVSQGILFPISSVYPGGLPYGSGVIMNGAGEERFVNAGDEIAEFLSITKYEPEIPVHMSGEMCALAEAPKYDFESIQKLPDLFTDNEEVSVTEKLHGTWCCIGLIPNLKHPDCFLGGSVFVTSKGHSSAGRVFKDVPENAANLYVKTLFNLVDRIDFGHKLLATSAMFSTQPIFVFGEIFGKGVQDMNYGTDAPQFRVFDIRVGQEYLAPTAMEQIVKAWGIESVPVLYHGPYSLEAMTALRDGKTELGGSHIREGIVIRSATEERHPLHGRKIGKFVSPDYLLRKGNTTEYQ